MNIFFKIYLFGQNLRMANLLKFCRSLHGIASSAASAAKYAVHNVAKCSTFPILEASRYSQNICNLKSTNKLDLVNKFLKPTIISNSVEQQRNRMFREISEDAQLYRIHFAKPKTKYKRKHPLESRPQMCGNVLKTLVKHPKKPNSANRKCILLKLSNGKIATAYVPGIGHNLQEHNKVLVQFGRVKDVPGLRLRVIRGKYDCGHVVKKSTTMRI
ncbi:40S ribosomal protein S12, mitochondrial [Caerostris darwini]|uniref:Small ribosomal subunit protein uS12m n=1 Tax=Caerostris darwini TaxID=1538125 RepID=A0AAV4T863_9ARAC|nr:40S ribosomal protein S12, mitochondrial [Caerostris darwini]